MERSPTKNTVKCSRAWNVWVGFLYSFFQQGLTGWKKSLGSLSLSRYASKLTLLKKLNKTKQKTMK